MELISDPDKDRVALQGGMRDWRRYALVSGTIGVCVLFHEIDAASHLHMFFKHHFDFFCNIKKNAS